MIDYKELARVFEEGPIYDKEMQLKTINTAMKETLDRLQYLRQNKNYSEEYLEDIFTRYLANELGDTYVAQGIANIMTYLYDKLGKEEICFTTQYPHQTATLDALGYLTSTSPIPKTYLKVLPDWGSDSMLFSYHLDKRHREAPNYQNLMHRCCHTYPIGMPINKNTELLICANQKPEAVIEKSTWNAVRYGLKVWLTNEEEACLPMGLFKSIEKQNIVYRISYEQLFNSIESFPKQCIPYIGV